MKLLSLDLSSSSTGYALMLEGEPPHILDYGTIKPSKSATDLRKEGCAYPWTFVDAIQDMVESISTIVEMYKPDRIVIEETNKGRNRYSQKLLEFLHHGVLLALRGYPIWYISTSTWRSKLGVALTKEDKKNNSKVYRAKREGVSKASVGVKGKINKKHVALRHVNQVYPDLDLRMKHNDIADAICVGLAYLKGAEVCDGT